MRDEIPREYFFAKYKDDLQLILVWFPVIAFINGYLYNRVLLSSFHINSISEYFLITDYLSSHVSALFFSLIGLILGKIIPLNKIFREEDRGKYAHTRSAGVLASVSLAILFVSLILIYIGYYKFIFLLTPCSLILMILISNWYDYYFDIDKLRFIATAIIIILFNSITNAVLESHGIKNQTPSNITVIGTNLQLNDRSSLSVITTNSRYFFLFDHATHKTIIVPIGNIKYLVKEKRFLKSQTGQTG